jgi:hypothetical protein
MAIMGGNVGIGTTSPGAKLDVEVSSGGAATIGDSLCSATGYYAVAMGSGTTASGWGSTAMGSGTTADGGFSTAMGSGTTASGPWSTAMGSGTTASGPTSTAMGKDTTASEYYSTAMGRDTTASGWVSTAMGYNTNAYGEYSTAMGVGTSASGYTSTAMGQGIKVNGDWSFGIGLSGSSKTITQDHTMAIMGGNVGINTVSPTEKLEVLGTVKATKFIGDGSSLSGLPTCRWTKTGNNIYYKTGNVGIGTTIPGTTLEVNGVITAAGGTSTNWNTAYGWDDHSTAGYLTEYTETDPQVGANTLNYLPKWDGSTLVTSTIYDNGNVGIGTVSPSSELDVAGTVTATEFRDSTPVAFHARNIFGDDYTTPGYKIVEFDSEEFDYGGNYDTVNYKFTAPTTGVYQFNAGVTGYSIDSGDSMGLYLFRNGILYKKLLGRKSGSSTSFESLSGSVTIKLNSNDYIQVMFYVSYDTSWEIRGGSTLTYFSGHRVA